MNIFIHFLINVLVAFPFGLSYGELFIVGLGGMVIDIDHIFYQIIKVKNFTIEKQWNWHKRENRLHRPHLYIFHTIEFVVMFLFVSYYVNWYLFLLSIGFALHHVADALRYVFYYRSLFPWVKFYSLVYFLSSDKKLYKSRVLK